ncbi:MAG TPA: flagellar hook capping FlgD N-terminal domain-containing protein [Enterovirga sp.]|jgi:flagellar basal-body rod modification protein FlgD|nr:flagellar hook capping FlgD N-terminal domain-containing protein [Enterovirga sp.]
MTTVTNTAAATTATASKTTTSPSADRAQIAGNFQQFLTLLTTQLKSQNPMDPLDTNQFTQQLVQFASVEQQLKTNDTLSSLLTSAKASTTASAATYVGLDVTADGATQNLTNGSASWTLNPPRAAKATVTIKDENGAVVATKAATLQAGAQAFSWDGKNAQGATVPDGSYTISVSAQDASGQGVAVSTEISGTVTAVDVSGSAPVLTVGSASVPLSTVKTIAYK